MTLFFDYIQHTRSYFEKVLGPYFVYIGMIIRDICYNIAAHTVLNLGKVYTPTSYTLFMSFCNVMMCKK